jgi:hypothetical protein
MLRDNGQRSEVTRILTQISEEYEAAQQGLTGLAYGSSQHDFIAAKMGNISNLHTRLQGLVGDIAIAMIAAQLDGCPNPPQEPQSSEQMGTPDKATTYQSDEKYKPARDSFSTENMMENKELVEKYTQGTSNSSGQGCAKEVLISKQTFLGKRQDKRQGDRTATDPLATLRQKGGQACLEKYGTDHYRGIGRKGGNTTKQRHDSQYYRRIGTMGREARRKKK